MLGLSHALAAATPAQISFFLSALFFSRSRDKGPLSALTSSPPWNSCSQPSPARGNFQKVFIWTLGASSGYTLLPVGNLSPSLLISSLKFFGCSFPHGCQCLPACRIKGSIPTAPLAGV